jgi:hypothetical protein
MAVTLQVQSSHPEPDHQALPGATGCPTVYEACRTGVVGSSVGSGIPYSRQINRMIESERPLIFDLITKQKRASFSFSRDELSRSYGTGENRGTAQTPPLYPSDRV